ncbi:MAG TPA: T9SS type A sorting domain-containing protein, partial [Ignavibacteria bacterium]|nr:T9SS type A sorting domain-containing protein [Ignavibacteria bacterium]
FPKGAPNTFWLCYYAIGSLTESTGKVSAWSPPDGGAGISAGVSFSSFKILNTKVRIYLRHTWVSDNILYLWSPITDNNNNRKCLFSENGSSLDNITGAYVSDSASQYWYQGTPPYTNGTYYPEITMRGYNGTNASGSWKFVNYDVASGDAPVYDSLRITFVRTIGTLSSAARVNSSADTTIDFGIIPQSSFVDKNFYLKNSGTANLTVSAVNFTGSYSANFTLLTSLPGAITPNDSALFTVRATNAFGMMKNSGNPSQFDATNGFMVLSTNDPSKPNLSVSLITDYALPVTLASFDAFSQKKDVKLLWSTSEEINNAGFEIQRQAVDKAGNASEWIKAGFVDGAGNSNETRNYSFLDVKPGNGKFNYRLKQIDLNGNYELFNAPNTVEIGRPANYDLSQNYPNPSNPVSKIDYQLPEDANVNISVYDLTGRLVKTLVNSKMDAGYYTAIFDGTNIASGIYIYRINVNGSGVNFTSVKKLVLIK